MSFPMTDESLSIGSVQKSTRSELFMSLSSRIHKQSDNILHEIKRSSLVCLYKIYSRRGVYSKNSVYGTAIPLVLCQHGHKHFMEPIHSLWKRYIAPLQETYSEAAPYGPDMGPVQKCWSHLGPIWECWSRMGPTVHVYGNAGRVSSSIFYDAYMRLSIYVCLIPLDLYQHYSEFACNTCRLLPVCIVVHVTNQLSSSFIRPSICI